MSGPPPAAAPGSNGVPRLLRRLSAFDGTLLTVGSVLGSGIFLTGGAVAAALPHPGLILLVWLAGGLLTMAGAVTYAELGTLFPRAGGLYDFLKEAYGPVWGFLYGWSAFWVIMSGGIAALAAGFAEYLGVFVPDLSTHRMIASLSVGSATWELSSGQLVAAGAILVLTLVNYLGVRQGATAQNLLTLLKVGSVLAFCALGLWLPAPLTRGFSPPLAQGSLVTLFGVAMIAVLWTYDGWYGLVFSAEELREPERTLPRALLAGTLIIMVLYLLLNVVYLKALPIARMAASTRIGEDAARALFGPFGGHLLSAAILVSIFGCLSATILYSSRIYMPMARDGLFFHSLARIDPRSRVPARSLWAQSLWAILLTLSGTYEQLFTYVTFVVVLFQVAAGVALFVLRRRRPALPRPYRAWGYPVVPALFVLASLLLVGNTLAERPVESMAGLGLLAIGLPAYAFWRRRTASNP